MSNEISMADSYDDFPRIEEAFQRRLDESLNPTGPARLLDLLAETLSALPAEEIVDVGCAEGEEAIEIARRFNLNVIAVDPVGRHLEIGRVSAEETGVSDRVTFAEGTVASTNHLPPTARPSCVDVHRCEVLYPALDGDLVDVDAALGEEPLDVGTGHS